jgi:hypothetical protein
MHLGRWLVLVSNRAVPVERDSVPVHLLVREPLAATRAVASTIADDKELWQVYGGWVSTLFPALWEEVKQMGRKSGKGPVLDLRPVIQHLGLSELLKQVGVKRVINEIGLNRVIAATGVRQVIDEVGLARLIAEAGLKQVIDEVGLDRLIAEAGLKQVIDEVGLDRVIDEIGLDRVIAETGLEALIAKLTPAQRRELLRRLQHSD